MTLRRAGAADREREPNSHKILSPITMIGKVFALALVALLITIAAPTPGAAAYTDREERVGRVNMAVIAMKLDAGRAGPGLMRDIATLCRDVSAYCYETPRPYPKFRVQGRDVSYKWQTRVDFDLSYRSLAEHPRFGEWEKDYALTDSKTQARIYYRERQKDGRTLSKVTFRKLENGVLLMLAVTRPVHEPQRDVIKRSLPRWRMMVQAADHYGLFDAGTPRITKVGLATKETKALHRVSGYWRNKIRAVRRGEWVTVGVGVRNYDPAYHKLCLRIDGARPICKPRPPGRETWGAERRGGSKRFRKVGLFIPPAVPVGRHEVEALLFTNNEKRLIARRLLKPELVVLFNPFDSALDDISVNAGKPLAESAATFYALDPQDLRWLKGRWPYDVTPYAPEVMDVALGWLEDIPEQDRADAEKVAAHFAGKVRADRGCHAKPGYMVWGKWGDVKCDTSRLAAPPTNVPTDKASCKAIGAAWVDPYKDPTFGCGADPNATYPSHWPGAPQISDAYLDTGANGPVKFGQCWVYGFTLSGLLRSLGIPTRMITVLGSAHDTPPYGQVGATKTCHYWDPRFKKCCRHIDPTSGKCCRDASLRVCRDDREWNWDGDIWNFHVWNEAWIPAVNPKDGWAVVDGTYGVGVPGRDAVRQFPPQPAGQEYPWGAGGEGFVYSEANLPVHDRVRRLVEGKPPWIEKVLPRVRRYSAEEGIVTLPGGQPDNVIDKYRPVATYTPAAPLRTFAGAPDGLWGRVTMRLRELAGRPPRVFASARAAESGPTLDIAVPDAVDLGASLQAEVQLGGMPSDNPVELVVSVTRFPRDFSGGAVDAPKPEVRHFEARSITPSGGRWAGSILIPGGAFDRGGSYRVVVGIDRVEGAAEDAFVAVQALPLELTLPETVAGGDDVPIRAVVRNAGDQAVGGVTLALQLHSAFVTKDPLSVGPRTLKPGQHMVLEVTARAVEAGRFVIGAVADSALGPSNATQTVEVRGSADLVIAVQPVFNVPIEEVFEVMVMIVNDGGAPAEGIEATLGSVPEIAVYGEASEGRSILAQGESWSPVWRLRATKAGVYHLPVVTTWSDGGHSEARLMLVVGGDDPDALPAVRPEESPAAGEFDWGADAEPPEPEASGPEPSSASGVEPGVSAPEGLTEEEPNNTFESPSPLQPGKPIQGKILPRGDADWYRLVVEHQGALEVRISDVASNLDPVFRVWNEEQRLVRNWIGPSAAGEAIEGVFDLPAPGAYALEVRDGANNEESPDSYSLSTEFRPTADTGEPNDTFETATPTLIGEPLSANILPMGDGDYYRVEVEHQGALEVRISDVASNLDPVFRLWNEEQRLVRNWIGPSAPGEAIEGVFDLPAPGAYVLEVRDGANNARSAEPYRLTLGFTAAADSGEPNNTMETASPIAVGKTMRANILPLGDADWYWVGVGHQGVLKVTAPSAPSELDLVFRIWNADGKLVRNWVEAKPPDTGADTLIDLPGRGTYYMEVRDGANDARSAEPYELNLAFTETADLDEPNNAIEAATRIALGEKVQANIMPRGDADWYRLEVSDAGPLMITISEVAPELDIVVRVWNADKRLVRNWVGPPAPGSDTKADVMLPEGGIYYLEVRDGANNASSAKPYSLTTALEPPEV